MAEVTKPMALDETLQDVADALDDLTDGYAGKTAYESAVDGGYELPESQFDSDLESQKYFTRPNLLDNWYFVGGGSQQGGGQFPINQRGQTSYSSTGMCIDRWALQRKDSTVTFSYDVQTGKVEKTASSGNYFQMYQRIECPLPANTKMTLSCLYSGGVNWTVLVQRMDNWAAIAIINIDSDGNNALKSYTFDSPGSKVQVLIGMTQTASGSIFPKAVKLELGDTQTLAHQDADGNWVLNEIPDYNQQLLRCQRYYRVNRTSGTSTYYGISNNAKDLRPEMRTTPSTGSFTLNGVTYYYRSAEL